MATPSDNLALFGQAAMNQLAPQPTWADAWNYNAPIVSQHLAGAWQAAQQPQFWIDAARQWGQAMQPGTIRAYHGSPYAFDRFDMSKIGTGEGAQAYGHGLYFAGNPEVAATYKLTPNQKTMGPAATWVAKAGGDWRKALEMFDRFTDGLPQTDAQAEVRAALVKGNTPGHMYEVNIHADPSQLLDWDKPLAEQSAGVRGAILSQPEIQRTIANQSRLLPDIGDRMSGQSAYANLANWRRGVDLSPQGDAAVSAAERLRQAGIPGIQYLDQGSRAAGEGSHNYVMFDPSVIEILRRYMVPGIIGGGAAATGAQQ